MKQKNTLDLNTVHECNRCLDCKTLHPQVSLINLDCQVRVLRYLTDRRLSGRMFMLRPEVL